MLTRLLLLSGIAAGVVLAACPAADGEGEGEEGEGEGEGETSGGPVDGDEDAHCGATVITVDEAACAEGEEEPAEGEDDDEYGDTLFNAAGDDDECKYHVAFNVDGVVVDQDATFVVTPTALDGGAAITGANVRAEVFLDETHGVNGGTTVEDPAGTYTISGVQFDESGRWTVRFHFFEDCADGETSPHGHAAFFIDVP